MVESYGLFLGALILVGGSLGDLLGRRLMFVVGCGDFRRCFRGFVFSAITLAEVRGYC